MVDGKEVVFPVGAVVKARVVKVWSKGVVAEVLESNPVVCLRMHVSQFYNGFVKNISDFLVLGDVFEAQVICDPDGIPCLSARAAGGLQPRERKEKEEVAAES